MFKNIEEAREMNHVAIGVIDEYVQALLRKDEMILRLNKEVDDLRDDNERLRKQCFEDMPKGGEGSE